MKIQSLLLLFLIFSSTRVLAVGEEIGNHIVSNSDTININSIVITATRTPRMLKDVPQLTRVISKSEIASLGEVQIEDILSSQLAGMEFSQAGYGTSMSFQGLDARYVLILVDGERLSGESYGNVDLSRITTQNIERIEIIKGASSVLYGSNAMGATINIITSKPKKKVEAAGSYRYAGFYQKNYKEKQHRQDKYDSKIDVPNMYTNGYLGLNLGKLQSATNVSYLGSDAYRMYSTVSEKRHYTSINGQPADKIIEVQPNVNGIGLSGFQTVNLSQRFDYQFSEKVKAKISGGYFWKNRYDYETVGKEWGYENSTGYNYNIDVNYTINKKHSLQFSLYDDTYFKRADTLSGRTPKQRHEFFVPRVIWTLLPNNHNRITIGTEFSRETLNYDLTDSGYGTRYNANTLSIYGQDEITCTNKFSTVVGVRLDGYAMGAENNLSVTPKIALIYNLNRFTLRGNYAMGFRNPTLKEKYMNYYQPMMGMSLLGNPDLKPETNNYFSLSSEYTSKSNAFNSSVNVYASLFKDKIDLYPTGGNLMYKNTADSKIYGVEWTAQLRLLKGWWAKGNYSYTHIVNAQSQGNQYIAASPHTGVVQTNYNYKIKEYTLNFVLSGKFFGKKIYEDVMPLIIPKPGGGRPEIITGVYNLTQNMYTMWNLAATVRYKNMLNLTIGVDNMFNYKPKLVSSNAAMTPGVNGYVSVGFNF